MVAGLATRLDLPYEQMDDLQLAVETVLGKHGIPGSRTTVELTIEDESIRIGIGPIAGESLSTNGGGEGDLGTKRLLNALVERVEVVQRDGSDWLRLEDGIRRQRVAG